ncbi:MAG: 30S ribosomal protein S12 methylthiotransferase RimO [Nitrospirae bacterium]|nr:30S ribosomal protein S12 methylthiotransferase RimO [Nitrospirota bacterium]
MRSPCLSIVTLGCPKNQADSERLGRAFAAEGFTCTQAPEDSDAILVNTCGFIEDARRESINEILQLSPLKAGGKKLIVFGCLAERYRDELIKEIPEIDAIFGVGQDPAMLEYLRGMEVAKTAAAAPQATEPAPLPYAYLKIADGCNRGCRFCAIPLIRGRLKSTAIGGLIEEARMHLKEGRKELILVSQDTASYGADTGESLIELIDALAAIDGDFWIRLMYLYPTSVTDALLECIKRHAHVVLKYLDIPIQHSEAGILRAMGRGGPRGGYIELFERIRAALPDVCLRTTLMVGFPGESARDFKALLSFMEEVKFDRLGVFAYSDEQGTAAFGMPGKVSKKTMQRRVEQVMLLQAEISYEKNRTLIGRQFKGVIDEVQDNTALARLYCHAPEIDGCVFIENVPDDFPTGDFVTIQITGADEYDLTGEIIY